MVKFRKIGLVLCASALILSFAGCSGSNNGSSSGSSSTPASSAASSKTESSTAGESSAASTTESSAAESTAAESSSAESTAAESTAEESAAAESSAEASSASEGDVKDYVYFDNSGTKWENVYAYWWNDDYHLITNKLTGDPYPANKEDGTQDLGTSWPGVQMEKVGDTDIYRCVMPVEASMIIFNSGVSDEEIQAGTIGYQTADMAFSDANAGQVYTIDTSVEAKAGRGVEKTKYKYNEGAWSDYTA